MQKMFMVTQLSKRLFYKFIKFFKKVLLHFNFLWKKKILHLYYNFSGYYFFPWSFYYLCFSFIEWRVQTEDIWTLCSMWATVYSQRNGGFHCSPWSPLMFVVSCDPANIPLQHLLPFTVARAPWFFSFFSLAPRSRIKYLAVSSR